MIYGSMKWTDCTSIKYQVVEDLDVKVFDPCCSSEEFQKYLKQFKKRGVKPKLLLCLRKVDVDLSSSSNK